MGKKVLLVDDMRTVIMSEKMMLAGQGYEIETASDGLEAIAKVAAKKPDIILLDLMMPRMNGIETCERLKGDPETCDIPIIMVTTKGEKDKVQAAFAAGCNDYVTKPINKMQLLTKMRNLLL